MKNRIVKALAVAMTMAMMLTITACGAKKEEAATETTEAEAEVETAEIETEEAAEEIKEEAQDTAAVSYSSLEEYLQSPELATEMESIKKSVEDAGMSIELLAEGNSLVYAYTFDESVEATDDVVAQLESGLESQASVFEDIASSLNEELSLTDGTVIVRYLQADGTVITEKEFLPAK